MPEATDYDALIVGAGPVGAALACALDGSGLRIALAEAAPAPAPDAAADGRILALSYGSRRILEGLGIWATLRDRATPIARIHVSDQGHLGSTRIEAAEQGVAALGYVLDSGALNAALFERLRQCSALTQLRPARLQAIEAATDGVRALLQRDGVPLRLAARLLVGADGSDSAVRAQLGIDAYRHDYRQTALLCSVATEWPHGNTAFERFTRDGPLALLPLAGQRCAVVWTQPDAAAPELLALPDGPFLDRLQAAFGRRLGRLCDPSPRRGHPLQRLQAHRQVGPRAVLIGNAAHTLHPVAAQGFNLGLRDAALLAERLAAAARAGADIGAAALLDGYAGTRRWDQRLTAGFTDTLTGVFGSALPPVALGRNLALLALELSPALRHGLARFAMGLSGRQTRLARGLRP